MMKSAIAMPVKMNWSPAKGDAGTEANIFGAITKMADKIESATTQAPNKPILVLVPKDRRFEPIRKPAKKMVISSGILYSSIFADRAKRSGKCHNTSVKVPIVQEYLGILK
jgi:hypothetical protein